MTDSYEAGKALSEAYNPGTEEALRGRYDDLVPGLSRAVVDFAWGQHYARDGLDIKTRWLATIAALTALGGQTRPQLKVNIAAALRAGVERPQLAATIWPISLSPGLPPALNRPNPMLPVFHSLAAEDAS